MTSTSKEGEEEKQKQIVAADAAYKAGIAAIRANDLESAIQFLGSSLEIRNEIFGEGSIEVAPTYLKYGCVLFWKAQEDNTVFGANAPGGAGGKPAVAMMRIRRKMLLRRRGRKRKNKRKKKKTTTEKTRTRKEAKTRKTKKKQTWNWRGSC